MVQQTPQQMVAPAHGPELNRRQRTWIVTGAVAAGVALAVVWSFHLVDGVIGDNVANALLGYDARETALVGVGTGLVFAFVTGLAGTFTACNIAVFGMLPKIAESARSGRSATLAILGPICWLGVGMVVVSALYGSLGVVFADQLPQLSGQEIAGLPGRIFQASLVFGLIGLAFVYLGLAALGMVRDPFTHAPRARLLTMGALIGLFLVGRPFPLFRTLFEYAAEQGNPLYGAVAFILQSVGNVLLVVIFAVLIMAVTRGGAARWLVNHPTRAAGIAGFALLSLGVFMLVYWDIRVPAMFGYGWFPTMPWN